MVFNLAAAFMVSLGLSFVLTPWVMRLATNIGAIDQPCERKVHKVSIPRLGGLSIYVSFFVGLLLFLKLDSRTLQSSWIFEREGIVSILLLLVVVCLGIWDDLRQLKASRKFVVQLVAANVAYFAGFNITSITHPFSHELLHLGMFSYPITVLWIVGITNAFNLIDGLDGLASGVAIIAFATIFPIAIFNRDMASATICLLLAGSLLGFLRYNFNPAKIFLGDSGSMFLGFMLAVVSIKSSTKGTAAFSMLVPVLALGLPIMDTLLSMIRRLLGSLLPDNPAPSSLTSKLKGMFVADRGHIHHRLIARGFSQKKAVVILYVVSCALGIGAFGVTIANNLIASLILVIVGAAVFIGVRQLRYREMSILRNGILLPLYDRPILNRDSMQAFWDLTFMLVSYYTAQVLAGGFRGESPLSDRILSVGIFIIGIQFVVFLFSGVYKRSFRLIGIDDVLSMLKTAGGAVIVSCTIHALIVPMSQAAMVFSLFDFFFLVTLTMAFRGSFQVLQHLHKTESKGGKNVLIYGADMNGKWILEKILQLNYSGIIPVGFLDDRPHLEGKKLNGYPVFGGHWKLPRLIVNTGIDEIVISSDSVKDEVLRRIRRLASQKRIRITRSKLSFEDFGYEKSSKQLVFAPHTQSAPRHRRPVPEVANSLIEQDSLNQPTTEGASLFV